MKILIQNKYWKINKDYNKEKLLYLLIDRPDRISVYNEFVWKNNKNQWHRNYDLPAIVLNLKIRWYKNDQLYRDNNKPTTIWFDGYKKYWSNGKFTK